MSIVPTLPNVVETSPDPVLEAAKLKYPPTPEELAAEKALQIQEARLGDLQRRVAKASVDIGAREGYTFGLALQPPQFDAEGEELRQDLTRALVKLNRLRAVRQARIWALWELENAKAAAKAQAEWQRRRGQ